MSNLALLKKFKTIKIPICQEQEINNQENTDIKKLTENEINDIVNNSDVLKKIKENNNKIYLLSFGNERFYGGLERIKIQGSKFKIFDEIVIVTDKNLKLDEEYQDFWNKHKDFIENNKRGYGYWIWKSHIIQNLMNKINDNDIILYVDAGCNLNVYSLSFFVFHLHLNCILHLHII